MSSVLGLGHLGMFLRAVAELTDTYAVEDTEGAKWAGVCQPTQGGYSSTAAGRKVMEGYAVS